MSHVLQFDDNRGGLAYPFLPDAWRWRIVSRRLDDEAAMAEIFQAPLKLSLSTDPATHSLAPERVPVNAPTPSAGSELALNTVKWPALRWVKDDKVLDLTVPGMNTQTFLERTGLQLSMHKGGYVLSKRLSRVMRPYRYWGFFSQDEVTIDYNEFLDGRLWDGCGQVSRGFIQRLADTLDPSTGSGQGLDDRHRHQLLHTKRFEVTTLHAGGQDKGHVLVVDDLAVDFMFPAGSAKQAVTTDDHDGGTTHWLDTLTAAMEMYKAQYWADVEALAYEVCPPIEVFEHGRDWLHIGKELRRAYSRVIRQAINANGEVDAGDASASDGPSPLSTSFDAARIASEAFLNQWPADKRHNVLIGAAAHLYAQGPQNGEPVRDTIIWQLGRKRDGEGNGREPGIAQMMLEALRQIGLLGKPVWTETAGALLYYREADCPQCAGVPVKISGVWFNLLRATKPDTPERMSLVPKPQREQAKARIADYVQDRFRGMMLFTEVIDNGPDGLRVVTRTPHGNLFGYVQRDHELRAIRHDQWQIAWATAVDGNVIAILQQTVA